MSTTTFSQPSTYSQTAAALIAFVAGVDARIGTFFQRRKAMDALYKLDDRALADIGIYRGHIERAVHGVLPESERNYL
jgi:uncharacterized protein YjiS (DUF1127 family)